MRIERVGVVGGGLMGSGIAEVCARHGLDVVVVDADDAAIKAGRQRIETSLANAVRHGKLDADVQQRTLDAVSFESEIGALSDRHLVVEAVTENEAVKTSIFR